ncbi:MAG: type IV pilus secretin PilQ, partial [Desulfosudaceae bacterium]
METKGQVKIISSPRVVTLDNKKATISQGQEIPYTSSAGDNIETEFEDAELKLEVTPHVTPDNRISMKIFIQEKEVGEVRIPGGEPPLNTKEAETELLVNDSDTIVIGGIIQETERDSEGGVPYLKDIPLLGHLFKTSSRTNEKSELLIFITPTVVRLD